MGFGGVPWLQRTWQLILVGGEKDVAVLHLAFNFQVHDFTFLASFFPEFSAAKSAFLFCDWKTEGKISKFNEMMAL